MENLVEITKGDSYLVRSPIESNYALKNLDIGGYTHKVV